MDRTVARLNIERYHKQLAREQDGNKCRILRQLLEQEERKLRKLEE